MCLFYLYANAKIEIHICSNKHETGLVYSKNKEGPRTVDLLLCNFAYAKSRFSHDMAHMT